MSALSLSARRAWIEIALSPRNMTGMPVALRKESVDRNIKQVIKFLDIRVALRKESVDRNSSPNTDIIILDESLSARRAWIEICRSSSPRCR